MKRPIESDYTSHVAYTRALEQYCDTLAQPEQELVAVWELQEDGWDTICDGDWLETLPVGTKLYTTPPKREWVNLTAEEAAECWTTSAIQTWKNFEAKLKEKNA